MLRTVPFVYPRTSPADLTQRPLSQKYGKEEARKSRNGGNGPGYRTQYFSPLSDGVASSPYWALMNIPHSSKFSKFTVCAGVVKGSKSTPGRRGDIGASRRRTRSGLATRAHQRRPWVLPRVWLFARRRVPYEGCASAARLQAGRKVRGGVSEDSRSYEVLPGEFG